MKAHLRYLNYVLRHKFFVARAWVALAQISQYSKREWAVMLWRALVHDASKFSRAEWGPYVAMFYGPPTTDGDVKRERQAAFNYAWLHHQHRNPHHWQHWVLREDSGKVLVLLPERMFADEMLADWLGAGPKALTAHSMATAVADTIAWYAKVYDKQQMRDFVRQRIESRLLLFAAQYGISTYAARVHAVAETRKSIVIPGR
jgi:hypothetical protein